MTDQRLVVLTGCSRGLGIATARAVLEDGYRLVGVSRTLSDEFRSLMDEHPASCHFEACDISMIDGLHAFSRALLDEHGAPWGLVNNAGIGTDGVLATMHESDIQQVVATNLIGPIVLTKYVTRAMLSRRSGRVVNVSSIIAGTGFSGLSVYAASKAGLEGFTRSLSRELGKRSITVNNVAPGYMETDMTAGLGASGLASVRRRAPLGLAAPDDVAPTILHLLSDAAHMITGATFTVDGGSTA